MPGTPQNSIMSDAVPLYMLPKVEQSKRPAKAVPKNDFERLARSRKFPEVDAYIEARKEYNRHFLPGGDALRELAITNPEQAGRVAGLASTIIDELENLQMIIQNNKPKAN